LDAEGYWKCVPWCVVAWVASFVGLPVHSSSPSSTWLRFFPSPPLGFLPRPRDSPGRVFRCRGVTPWCSLRVSRLSSPVPFLLGTGGPGGVSGRPVRPGFVLGSRLDVPSLGRLRRGCPLFLSAPHSGSPPGFVRRRRLAPDAAVCGVEMPWVPCSRPAVVLLAPCPGSDLGSRPGGPWATGIPPRLPFRTRGSHLPRGRWWSVPVQRATGKPGCLPRCVRSL
jgi:hypothetical protein